MGRRLWEDPEGLGLKTVPGRSGDDLAGAEAVLAVSLHHGRAVVVDVADDGAAGGALKPGARAVDAPVVESLEEGADLVFLDEP